MRANAFLRRVPPAVRRMLLVLLLGLVFVVLVLDDIYDADDQIQDVLVAEGVRTHTPAASAPQGGWVGEMMRGPGVKL